MTIDKEFNFDDLPKKEEIAPIEERSERVDVHAMHAPMIREHDEPGDGHEPLPFWMLMTFAALLFWGGYYMATNNGAWERDRFDTLAKSPNDGVNKVALVPDTPEKLFFVGKGLYATHCTKCHADDGRGTPMKTPPLAGADWVIADDGSRAGKVVLFGLKGKITVAGAEYDGECPSFQRELNDADIAAILTYIRQDWGHKAAPVLPDAVNAWRKAPPTAGS